MTLERIFFKQKTLLTQLEIGKVSVALYLANGVRLVGTIIGSDDYYIYFMNKNRSNQLVFKHAILSIVPTTE